MYIDVYLNHFAEFSQEYINNVCCLYTLGLMYTGVLFHIVGWRSICSPLQSLLKYDLQYRNPCPSLKVVNFIECSINLFLFFVKTFCSYFIYDLLIKVVV